MQPPHRFVRLLWVPGLMYSGYAICRLSGIRGDNDIDGISAVMRIVFLAFGGGVAYFLTVLSQWEPFRSRLQTGMWHALAGWSMAMIVDDAFMVHEQLGAWLHIKDTIPMLMLGVWLLAILAIHRHRMIRSFWLCFLGFALLSALGTYGDVASGREGTLSIRGFDFDYEMVSELTAILFLVAGLALQAGTEIAAAAQPSAD